MTKSNKNELRNREARLRRAARKKDLTLQKGYNHINGYTYAGYRLGIGESKMFISGYAGYESLIPYSFTIEEAEQFVESY